MWEAPSIEDFYRTHRQYVWRIGKRVGVPLQLLDDAVNEVFARIVEIDMLSTYDPQQVPFTQWIGHYVGLRMMGIRDKYRSKAREVPWGLDLEHLMPVIEDGWTEVVDTVTDLCVAARQWRFDEPLTFETWEAVHSCTRRTGGAKLVDLAVDLGGSITGAGNRLFRLRQVACEVAGLPAPKRRARVHHASPDRA